ncbi:MAG: hydrolase [Ilumatobacter coccineus]|uniref:Hydrolase n=1 Tax=Ilumatobacter coccineus TaxID=467094 RepID=A0A2G6K8Y1_9ACTN|nr:MAG: hydrolase [Ilumatobacter coccineus]
MTSLAVNGITLEYDEHGDGEPLVLVMGLGGQLIDWPLDLVELFVERGFRVIRFDNRDSGLSTVFSEVAPPSMAELFTAIAFRRPLRASYLLSDMADDVIGLLDALDIDQAHIVGASMGGMIAQELAIGYPERVRSLTSIMSTTGARGVGGPTWRVRASFIQRERARKKCTTDEELIDVAVDHYRLVAGPRFDALEFRKMMAAGMKRSFQPEGTARQMAAISASGDRTHALATVEAPSLVIHGMADTLIRPSGGVATSKAIPGSRLLMFNDMGHDLPRSRWREVTEAIADHAHRVVD